MLDRGEVEAFLREAVRARKNILISGGTSSGKTTFLRALLSEAGEADRVLTIEDARELHPTQPNSLSMLASRRQDAEGVSDASALLEAALRMRPDRIILGELRGVEAYAFLEAINTGHPGSLATIHADDPAAAFDRLALMVLRANRGLGRDEVVAYARSIIDIVVQLGRDADGARRVRAIELSGARSRRA